MDTSSPVIPDGCPLTVEDAASECEGVASNPTLFELCQFDVLTLCDQAAADIHILVASEEGFIGPPPPVPGAGPVQLSKRSCISWGDPHIINFQGQSYNCQNRGSQCGFIPLISTADFEVAMFNEPFYPGASVTIMTQIRIQLFGANAATLLFTTDQAFPNPGTVANGDIAITFLGRFDRLVELLPADVTIRVWRRSAAQKNYLNVDIMVGSIEMIWICIYTSNAFLFFIKRKRGERFLSSPFLIQASSARLRLYRSPPLST